MLLTKPTEEQRLIDKTGAVFPITKEAGCDILLNSVPIYMADKGNELDSGVDGITEKTATQTGNFVDPGCSLMAHFVKD